MKANMGSPKAPTRDGTADGCGYMQMSWHSQYCGEKKRWYCDLFLIALLALLPLSACSPRRQKKVDCGYRNVMVSPAM